MLSPSPSPSPRCPVHRRGCRRHVLQISSAAIARLQTASSLSRHAAPTHDAVATEPSAPARARAPCLVAHKRRHRTSAVGVTVAAPRCSNSRSHRRVLVRVAVAASHQLVSPPPPRRSSSSLPPPHRSRTSAHGNHTSGDLSCLLRLLNRNPR